MKKLFVLMALTVLMASSALGALDFKLSENNVNVPKGGVAYVEVTVTTGAPDYTPVENVVLDIVEYCRERDTDMPQALYCNAGDVYSPSEVTVSVTSPTDVNGKATVTLTHDGSDDAGSYHYTVCDVTEGSCGAGAASVTGDFYIPEFTTIGAGLMLLGAGLYAYRKRN